MKHQIKSIFEQISTTVFEMTDVQKAKTYITEFVSGKGINDNDKTKILKDISNIPSIIKLQQYVCNSLLKYEGMGVGEIDKSARKAASETINS